MCRIFGLLTGSNISEAVADADVGAVELVNDALVHGLLARSDRRVQQGVLVRTEPGTSNHKPLLLLPMLLDFDLCPR